MNHTATIELLLINKASQKDISFLPYFPRQDEELAANFNLSRIELLEHYVRDLKKLVNSEAHVFWSHILYDESLKTLLDTYLRNAPRPFNQLTVVKNSNTNEPQTTEHKKKDSKHSNKQQQQQSKLTYESELENELYRRVFMVLWRLVTPEKPAKRKQNPFEATADADGDEDMSLKTDQSDANEPQVTKWYAKLAPILSDVLNASGILDAAKLIDICAIYGYSNPALTKELVGRLFMLNPRYYSDLRQSTPLIANAIVEVAKRRKLTSDHSAAAMTNKKGKATVGAATAAVTKVAAEDVIDVFKYLFDIVFNLRLLLDTFPFACFAFRMDEEQQHQQAEETNTNETANRFAFIRLVVQLYEIVIPELEKSILDILSQRSKDGSNADGSLVIGGGLSSAQAKLKMRQIKYNVLAIGNHLIRGLYIDRITKSLHPFNHDVFYYTCYMLPGLPFAQNIINYPAEKELLLRLERESGVGDYLSALAVINEECYQMLKQLPHLVSSNDKDIDVSLDSEASLQSEHEQRAGTFLFDLNNEYHISATFDTWKKQLTAVNAPANTTYVNPERINQLCDVFDDLLVKFGQSAGKVIVNSAATNTKKHGKAAEASAGLGTLTATVHSAAQDSTLQSLKSMFPDFSFAFLKECLDHYSGDMEEVVSRLTEGDLPPELDALDRKIQTCVSQPSSFSAGLPTTTTTTATAAPHGIGSPVDYSPMRWSDNFNFFKAVAPSSVQLGKRNTNDAMELLAEGIDDTIKQRVIESMMYEDEYDDSYDSYTRFGVDAAAGSSGSEDEGADTAGTTNSLIGSGGAAASAGRGRRSQEELRRIYQESQQRQRQRQQQQLQRGAGRGARGGRGGSTSSDSTVVEQQFEAYNPNRGTKASTRWTQRAHDERLQQEEEANEAAAAADTAANSSQQQQQQQRPASARNFDYKEQHKARIGNHNRKKAAAKKMRAATGQ